LTPHTEASWTAARSAHPVLSRASTEKARDYSHFADIPDEHLSGDAPRWLQVVRPALLGSHLQEVVLMSQIIPPDRLRAFYHAPMWKERHLRRHGRHAAPTLSAAAAVPPHYHGHLHALGIAPNAAAIDRMVDILVAAQELVDTQTTAAGLLAHHPDLATVQTTTAAHIRDANILPDPRIYPDQYNAMQALSNAIAETPSWSPIADCTDQHGNPIKAEYALGEFTPGQQLQTFGIADHVLSAAAPAVVGAQRLSNDDLQLQNQLWSPAPGTSVLKSSDGTSSALRAAEAVEDTQFKWTVPYQTYTYGVKLNKDSLHIDGQGNFSIDCLNLYNRTLYAAYELLSDQGNALGPRQGLGSFSAVDNIMGIPVPVIPTTEQFNIAKASSIKLYFGSLGASNWDKVSWDEMNVSDRGTLYTCAWQYGVPIVFIIAGKIITDTKWFNTIVNDRDLSAAALAILFPLVGGGVATAAALTNWQRVMLKFANVVISFAVKKGMEKLGEWLVAQVGAGQLTKAFGPVGWLFQLAAVALNVEQIAITTGEVLASDALMVAEIKRAIDVSLLLHPDPHHGEAGHPETAVWPSVATNFVATLQCQGGTNFEVKGTLPSTTSNAPITIAFKDVPAGGNIRIIVGLYSQNGWLAGSWQNNWTPAMPNQGTTLNLGDQNLTENLVPLGIDTQYVYKEKIAYAASAFSWDAKSNPPAATLAALNCANNGSLCELTGMTINNSAFQAGFAWRAANQHLHPDTPTAPVSDSQLYAVQNLSVLTNPGSRLKSTQIGFSQKPGIAYAPSTNTKTIDQTNFILDPRHGSMNLRQVLLDDGKTDFGLGDTTMLSWGSFPLDNLDALAIHPSNAVLACSFSKHKLMILKLPDHPAPDGQAPEALMVSGEGIREGLLKGPKALAVAPDGRILILESLNNRVQAFDILGNAVPCFTPTPQIFTLNKADVSASLDDNVVPAVFLDGLVQAGHTYVAPLPDSSFIEELDSGMFQLGDKPPQTDPLMKALADLLINLAYDEDAMHDPAQSAQIQVVQKGQSWLITDPRQRAWQILNQSGLLNVYQRPVRVEVEVQQPGNRWLLRDSTLGLAWVLQVSSGDPNLVEIFDCFTYCPLQAGPNGANLNYLDMAVEAQGYMYVLSYINDGSATTDYLLDVYSPDGTFLFRSPDTGKSTKPQNIVAGRIAVDIWRDLYALTYETFNGPGGGTQPGLAHWMPTPPLFGFPLTEQPNFNAQNISAVKADFAAHGLTLSNDAFILVENRDGYWQVKDGTTIYHVYRSGDALQVYAVPA
jgi:hypothetical protein